MSTKSILAMLMMTLAILTLSFNRAEAAGVDVNISGFLPAPPGVVVRVDAGRPYYVQHDRRVYMQRDRGARHRRHDKERYHGNFRENGGDKGNPGGHGEGGRGH